MDSTPDTPSTHDAPARATTTHGPIRGRWSQGIARFSGIPYAAPPVGPLRFRPPAPAEPWLTERSTEQSGPIAPQNPSIMDALYGGEPQLQSEDCLTLNVWTTQPVGDPAVAVGAPPRPVMVWIHGGGFEMGSGSSPMYDGTRFAESGVVLVTVNYRLGALGFLELSGIDESFAGSGNLGLLDQIAALRWVQDNIANFGGDPDNVTVFGQSAGSISIAMLLASPEASGLFSKAITQSGSTNIARTLEVARSDAAEFMERGGWTSIAELQNAPVDELLAAHAALSAHRFADPEEFVRRTGDHIAILAFRPVADGLTVPLDPLQAIASGSATGIPLLVGTTSQEWRLFAMMSPPVASETELLERLGLVASDSDAALATYRLHDDHPLSDIECDVLTDFVFRVPAARMADAQAQWADTYEYIWDWKSDALGGMIGAAHAIEIPFIFDVVDDERLGVFIGDTPPKALARSAHEAWIAFAVHGVPAGEGLPEWPTVHATEVRQVMVLDIESRLVHDPRGSTRQFWDTPAGAVPPRT